LAVFPMFRDLFIVIGNAMVIPGDLGNLTAPNVELQCRRLSAVCSDEF
jgi:hypothetical protein